MTRRPFAPRLVALAFAGVFAGPSGQAASAPATEAPSASASAGQGADGWPPHLSVTVGAEAGTSAREVDVPPTREGPRLGKALSLQMALDIVHHDIVGGVFGNLGVGSPSNMLWLGLRGGYRLMRADLKWLGEAGAHAMFDIDNGLFMSSDVPGATLLFLGARVEWAPRAHGVVSPLLALGLRQDLTTTRTSGTVSSGFFGGTDRRSYELGGTTLTVQVGANFDFGGGATSGQ